MSRWFRGTHDSGDREDWLQELAEQHGVDPRRARELYAEARHAPYGNVHEVLLLLLKRESRSAAPLAPGKRTRVEATFGNPMRWCAPKPGVAPGKITRTMRVADERGLREQAMARRTAAGAGQLPNRDEVKAILRRSRAQDVHGDADISDAIAIEPHVERLAAVLGLDGLDVRFDETARAHRTRGVTIGRTIHLDPRRFDARTREGTELLAHEAVHVAQRQLPGPASASRGEAEASFLARQYATTGSLVRPRQAIASGAARDEELSDGEHEDAMLAHPIPMEAYATLSGLVLRPVQRDAQWVAGLHIGRQLVAAILARLVRRAYSVALLRDVLAMVPARFHFVGYAGHATEDQRAIGAPHVLPGAALDLIGWLERDKGLTVHLTADQRKTLVGAAHAEEAWPLVRLRSSLPAWYTEALFRYQIGSHASLLERFGEAHAAWKQSAVPENEARLEKATDALGEAVRDHASAIDAIRSDRRLTNHPIYRGLWSLPALAGAPDAAEPSPVVDEDSQVNEGLARHLLNVCNNEGTREGMRQGGDAGHRARKRVLDAITSIAREERIESQVSGDQRLTDVASRATVPPVPSWMRAYPALQPPFFDRAAGASHTFQMSLQYPDDLEAISAHFGNHFFWEVIRVPDEDLARLREKAEDPHEAGEVPGRAAVYGQRLRRQARYAAADVQRLRAIEGLSAQLGPPGGGAGSFVAASRMVGAIGTVIKTFIQQISQPASERLIALDEPGLYAVRCTVTNVPDQDRQPLWVRAQSVAWLPMYVRPPEEMAALRGLVELELRNAHVDRLAAIEKELAQDGLDDARRALLLDEKRRIEIGLHGSLSDVLHLEREQLHARQRELESNKASAQRAGRGTEELDAQLSSIQRRLDEIRDSLASRNARLDEHRPADGKGLEAPFRLPAIFVDDDGRVTQLALEMVQQTATEGMWRYYVSDSTTSMSGDELGPEQASRVDAMRAAVLALLEEPDRYGRGHCTLLVPPPSGQVGAFQQVTFRVEADEAAIAMEGIQNITTMLSIAAVAAAPFTGGASLVLMVPIGVVGAIPSAYRLVDRASSNTLRMDVAAAMDIVDIVGGVAGFGQMAAGARMVRLGGACMILGMGTDGLGFALAGAQFIEQVGQIDPTAPPGVRRAMLMELVANQLMTIGLQVGGELAGRAQMARMQAGQGAADVHMPRANAALHEALRRHMGTGGGDAPIFQLDTPGRTVEVHYRLDGYGLVQDVHLRVGRDATDADIAPFASTVRAMQQLEGVQGGIRRLIDRLRTWLSGQPHIPVGSRAWEAKHAIEALPRAMRDLHDRVRRRELDQASVDEHLAQIRRDLAAHEQAIDEMEQGAGAIGARQPDSQAAVSAGYPPAPDGHFYVQQPDGTYQLERYVNSPVAPKRVRRGEGGGWEVVDGPTAARPDTAAGSRRGQSELPGQPGSRDAHGQFGVDPAARARSDEHMVAPEAFMDADYLLGLYDGDIAALVRTLKTHYRGSNKAIRVMLDRGPSWPEVRQLLDGGGAVTPGDAAAMRHLLAVRNLDRIPPSLRAAALAHSGVEVHNHYKGVLEADYYVKRLFGDDSDASYRKALDTIRDGYQADEKARGESPDVWAILQRGYGDENARTVYDQIMRAGADIPFDQTYDPRGILMKVIMGRKGGAQTLFRDTLRRLRADGITYAELQMKPDGLGLTHEEFQRICQEEGVEVGILMHLVSERDLGGNKQLTEADLLAMLRAGDKSPLGAKGTPIPRDMLRGFDVAGAEKAAFTPTGMKNLETAYKVLKDLALEDGQPRVLRPHVGEGYSLTAESRGQGVDRGGPEADIAQKNIETLLEHFEQMHKLGTYVKPDEGGQVLVRFGHVTHITEAQAKRMATLGIVAEVNIGSNVATGSLPRPKGRTNRLSEHPLLMLLYYKVGIIPSTDAQGVMGTNLPKEYELAQKIIDEFKSGKEPLEVDGRVIDWTVLTPEEQADLDRDLNLDRIREAALQYRAHSDGRL